MVFFPEHLAAALCCLGLFWLRGALVLPAHAELLTAALVEPGTGRRAVPSEAEKGLMREREQLKMQLARAHAATDEQQQRVQVTWVTPHI